MNEWINDWLTIGLRIQAHTHHTHTENWIMFDVHGRMEIDLHQLEHDNDQLMKCTNQGKWCNRFIVWLHSVHSEAPTFWKMIMITTSWWNDIRAQRYGECFECWYNDNDDQLSDYRQNWITGSIIFYQVVVVLVCPCR